MTRMRLNPIFKDALIIIKNNRRGNVFNTDFDIFSVDYNDNNTMMADARDLMARGYACRMNKQFATMEVTVD